MKFYKIVYWKVRDGTIRTFHNLIKGNVGSKLSEHELALLSQFSPARGRCLLRNLSLTGGHHNSLSASLFVVFCLLHCCQSSQTMSWHNSPSRWTLATSNWPGPHHTVKYWTWFRLEGVKIPPPPKLWLGPILTFTFNFRGCALNYILMTSQDNVRWWYLRFLGRWQGDRASRGTWVMFIRSRFKYVSAGNGFQWLNPVSFCFLVWCLMNTTLTWGPKPPSFSLQEIGYISFTLSASISNAR